MTGANKIRIMIAIWILLMSAIALQAFAANSDVQIIETWISIDDPNFGAYDPATGNGVVMHITNRTVDMIAGESIALKDAGVTKLTGPVTLNSLIYPGGIFPKIDASKHTTIYLRCREKLFKDEAFQNIDYWGTRRMFNYISTGPVYNDDIPFSGGATSECACKDANNKCIFCPPGGEIIYTWHAAPLSAVYENTYMVFHHEIRQTPADGPQTTLAGISIYPGYVINSGKFPLQYPHIGMTFRDETGNQIPYFIIVPPAEGTTTYNIDYVFHNFEDYEAKMRYYPQRCDNSMKPYFTCTSPPSQDITLGPGENYTFRQSMTVKPPMSTQKFTHFGIYFAYYSRGSTDVSTLKSSNGYVDGVVAGKWLNFGLTSSLIGISDGKPAVKVNTILSNPGGIGALGIVANQDYKLKVEITNLSNNKIVFTDDENYIIDQDIAVGASINHGVNIPLDPAWIGNYRINLTAVRLSDNNAISKTSMWFPSYKLQVPSDTTIVFYPASKITSKSVDVHLFNPTYSTSTLTLTRSDSSIESDIKDSILLNMPPSMTLAPASNSKVTFSFSYTGGVPEENLEYDLPVKVYHPDYGEDIVNYHIIISKDCALTEIDCNDGIDNDCDAGQVGGGTDCEDIECEKDRSCAPGLPDCGLALFDPALYDSVHTPSEKLRLAWTRQSSMFPITYKLVYSDNEGLTWKPLAGGSATTSLNYEWPLTGLDGTYLVKLTPNDGVKDATVNITRIIVANVGILDGFVTCGEGDNAEPVEGATVYVEGTSASATTDAEGYYRITNAPIGTKNLIASIEGSLTQRQEYVLASSGTLSINFDKVCPIRRDCEADCTLIGGDICMAECNGFEQKDSEGNVIDTCNLYTPCVNIKKGLHISDPADETIQRVCCEGESSEISDKKTNFKINESIETEDVIRTTRVVYYDGEPVKMIVVAWK